MLMSRLRLGPTVRETSSKTRSNPRGSIYPKPSRYLLYRALEALVRYIVGTCGGRVHYYDGIRRPQNHDKDGLSGHNSIMAVCI